MTRLLILALIMSYMLSCKQNTQLQETKPTVDTTDTIIDYFQRSYEGHIGGRKAIFNIIFDQAVYPLCFYYYIDEHEPHFIEFVDGGYLQKDSINTNELDKIHDKIRIIPKSQKNKSFNLLFLSFNPIDSTGSLSGIQGLHHNIGFYGILGNYETYKGFYLTNEGQKIPFEFKRKDFIDVESKKYYKSYDIYMEAYGRIVYPYIDLELLSCSPNTDPHLKQYLDKEFINLIAPSYQYTPNFSVSKMRSSKSKYFDISKMPDSLKQSHPIPSRTKRVCLLYKDDNLLGVLVKDDQHVGKGYGNYTKYLLHSYDLLTQKHYGYKDVFKEHTEKAITDLVNTKYKNDSLRVVESFNAHNFMLTRKGVYYLVDNKWNGCSHGINAKELFLTYNELKDYLSPDFKLP